MKILITGSTGFVGSHLCDLFVKKGHDVFSMARNKNKFLKLKIPGKPIICNLPYHHADQWINQLPKDLDAVIHTAGIVHTFDSSQFYQINVKATEQLIKDLKVVYPKLKFCLISSLASMGPTKKNLKLNEIDHARPVNHYGRSKYHSEIALKTLAPEAWQKIIIQPPMVIGPRDLAFLDVFKMVKRGIVPTPGLKGRTKQYSFISIYDLIDLIYQAITNDLNLPHEPYNEKTATFFASHPQVITYEELITNIGKTIGKKNIIQLPCPMFVLKATAYLTQKLKIIIPTLDTRLTPDKIKEISAEAWTCCSEKSKSQLNFKYSWDLYQTLEKTYNDDYKNQLN